MNPGPGFIQVLAFYTNASGHPCQNSMGYSVDPGFDQTTADAISDWLAPSYKAQITTASVWRGVRVIVGNDGEPGEFDSSSSAGVGARGGDLLTPQTQGLIHKRTALAGRSERGRMYIPDMEESQVNNDGLLNGSAIALLQAIADAWFGLSASDALILAPQLLHEVVGSPTPITAMTVETMVATQRRRYRRA